MLYIRFYLSLKELNSAGRKSAIFKITFNVRVSFGFGHSFISAGNQIEKGFRLYKDFLSSFIILFLFIYELNIGTIMDFIRAQPLLTLSELCLFFQ